MENTQPPPLLAHFSVIEDPRIERTKRHSLINIIAIAICAPMISMGRSRLVGGRRKVRQRSQGLVRKIPRHPQRHPVPRHARQSIRHHRRRTFPALLRRVGPRRRRTDGGASGGDRRQDPAPVIRQAFGQVGDPRRHMLDVSGCLAAIDAMGCQKDIARKIVDKGADYTLALKKNQGNLYKDAVEMFGEGRRTNFADMESDWRETVEKSRGRVEIRRCRAVFDPEWIAYMDERGEWANLGGVALVESERVVDGKRERLGAALLHHESSGRRRANTGFGSGPLAGGKQRSLDAWTSCSGRMRVGLGWAIRRRRWQWFAAWR